ncbi:DUF389 domain-containing protein [Patescibacteria group bacterium]
MPVTTIVKETHKKNIVATVIRESTIGTNYYLLLALATLITTFGLTLDSESILIGGMLMAPLLRPILAFGLAIVTISFKSFWRSLFGIFTSVGLVLVLSYFSSWMIHPDSYLTNAILTRGIYSHLYLFVAILSGIGATYTLMDPKLPSALPAVAVSVSLLPPLCVSGIAMAQESKSLLQNSLKVFGANLGGIIIASTFVFLIFRFRRLKKHEEKEISKSER